jgi:ankyrin repeat protein
MTIAFSRVQMCAAAALLATAFVQPAFAAPSFGDGICLAEPFATWGSRPFADAPLADAARRGDLDAVRSLLARGEDVNGARSDGMTAMHWAAERGDLAMAKLLLSKGPDLGLGTRIGAYTPLHVASRRVQLDIVAELLAAGADVNARTTYSGSTPLHLAAAEFGGEQVVAALLRRGADVNAREASAGQTPLMFAAANDRAASVRALLGAGADPAIETTVVDVPTRVAQDRRGAGELKQILDFIRGCGLTPSREQIEDAILEVRKTLDAPLNPGEQWGPPVRREHDNVRARFGQYLSIREVHVDKWGGMTALLHASRDGAMDAAMALLDGGADIDQVSGGTGDSALLLAAINGHFDLALRLLERGADPNLAATNDGLAPLFAVINTYWGMKSEYPQPRAQDRQQVEYLALVEALLEAGANPNAQLKTNLWFFDHNNISGQELTGATPLWRAALARDVQLLRLLGSHGADASIHAHLPALGLRHGRKQDSRTDDDSGLTPLPEGTPDTWPIQMAAGGGQIGFANFSYRYAPNGALPSVQYLVEELGADVNVSDAWGYTPLHYAAAWGQNDVIEYLVSKGADVMVKTRLGQTLVDMAAGGYRGYYMGREYPETVKLLESYGVKGECRDLHFGGTGHVCAGAVANGATDYRSKNF